MKFDSYEYKNRFFDGISASGNLQTCPCCGLSISGCDCGFSFTPTDHQPSALRKGLNAITFGLFFKK